MNDERLEYLESLLRQQASRLTTGQSQPPRSEAIAGLRRRRRLAKLASSGAAMLLLAMLASRAIEHRAMQWAIQSSPPAPEARLAADQESPVTPDPEAPNEGSRQVAEWWGPDRADTVLPVTLADRNRNTAKDLSDDQPQAYPVLITVGEGDTEKVIATGFYVPEHQRRMRMDQLPGRNDPSVLGPI